MIEQIDTTKTNRSMSELDEALAKVAELVENGERLMAVADSAARDAADMAEAKCAPLRDQIHQLQFDQQWAFDLVYRIRQALGDNGKLMQDELIEHCRKLVADAKEAEELRARVAELVASLDELLGPYTGGAESALHDDYIVERAIAARDRAPGETA